MPDPLLFPDISEFQPHADIVGIRQQTGAISARLAYGIRSDHMMPDRINQIRSQKFAAVMYYHFLTSDSVLAQLREVSSVLTHLEPGEGVFLDWEKDGSYTPPLAQRDAMISALNQYYGQPTGLYSSASFLKDNPTPEDWIASYGVSEPTLPHLVWQATNGQYAINGQPAPSWAGIGKCDTNLFHGTAEQLGALIAPHGGPQVLNAPLAGIISTPSGNGYYLFGTDGGVFAYGDAKFFGSMGGKPLNKPIAGMAVRPQNDGYWLAAQDYGVFAFGAAQELGHP